MIPIKKRILFLSVLLTIFLLGMAYPALAADTVPPTLSSPSPAAGSNITTPSPEISVHVSDSNQLNYSSLSLVIDGQPVPAQFVYDFVPDPFESYLDPCNGTIKYTAPFLTDGVHTVTASMADYYNNIGMTTWSFTVSAPPQFDSLSPANNSLLNINTPTISAHIVEDNLHSASIKMFVDNIQVNYTFDSSTNIVSYQPGVMSQGKHTVNLSASDTNGFANIASWSFTVDTQGPTYQDFIPTVGGSTNTYFPYISVTAKDLSKIDKSSVTVKLDGLAVPFAVKYGGYWDYPMEMDPWWVETDNTTAIIEYYASNLTDGNHTITVTSTDIAGNSSEFTWNFNVSVPPIITDISPANNSFIGITPTISATVTDYNLDPASVKMMLDNTQVASTFDQPTGHLSYSVPTALSQGNHTVTIIAVDTMGNQNTTNLNYNIDSQGPTFSGYTPGANTNVNTYSPYITITAKDTNQINKNSLVVKLDGVVIPAAIKYNGYWDYPCEEPPVWRETDNTTAIIEYSASNLTDGPHIISVSIADIAGNKSETNWSFTETVPPTIDTLTPADNSINKTTTPTISAKVYDYNLNPASIKLLIDNVQVNATYDQAASLVTYQIPTPLSQGTHSVTLMASDTMGNLNTTNWNITVDTLGPVFSAFTPIAGSDVDTPSPQIAVTAKDANQINKNSLVVKLDGVVVPANIIYDGYWDYPCEEPPVWRETDNTTAFIDYNATNLLDTVHTISVTIADMTGNVSTTEWSFIEVAPPQLTSQTPAPDSKVNSLTPRISAIVTDLNPLDPAKFTMNVNGKPVNFSFDPATGTISYLPTDSLPQEAYNTVDVTVYNTSGVSKLYTWQFYSYTYTQEMPVPPGSPNNCDYCHKPANHPLNNCNSCHGELIPRCDACHGSSHDYSKISNGNQALGHGYNIYTVPFNGTFYCTTCHSWDGANPNVVPREHFETMDSFNVAINHKSPTTGCEQCHATTLTREHQMRQDKAGNAITCDTCHTNPPADMADKVKTAIANNDSRCEACHTGDQGPHPAHTTSLDSNCATCHNSTLLTEKQYHSSNGCVVCHSSTNKIVTSAIKAQTTDCNACHDKAHTLNLSSSVPADVPLYSGYSWIPPQKAQIWSGESWLPADYNTPEAKLVISNRRNDVYGTDIYNWYTTQLTTLGWTKVTGPTAGSNNFTLTYSKEGRLLTVIFYGGSDKNNDSPILGYKIEILYK